MGTTKVNKAIIVGAGSYAQVYLSYFQEAQVEVLGFLDDDVNLIGKYINEVKVLGNLSLLDSDMLKNNVRDVYCLIGNNKTRVDILTRAQSLGYLTPNFIHKSVEISSSVLLGKGVYILPNTTILPHCSISDFVMISAGTNIIHHSSLGQGVFVSNGCNVGAFVRIKENAFVGMGATIMSGPISIGINSIIGAGAVVIKSVEDNLTVVGNPSRIIKSNKNE